MNISTINVSTINAKTINMSTLNVSDLNSSFANITSINTRYIEPSATEITNDAFLYTTTTTGVVSIATGITTGAINVGNELSTGSLSISKGTININPKTLLNMANLLTTGTANMFNASTFTGTVNFANTSNLSGTTNKINFGSLTSNISMVGRLDIGTTNDNVNISGSQIRIDSAVNKSISIGTSQTSSIINIGGALAAGIRLGTNISSGNIEIGTFLKTGYIEIGSLTSSADFYMNTRTGIFSVCNFDEFAGTINIAATANMSNASTNIINIGSTTTSSLNIKSKQIQIGTSQVASDTISIGTSGASTLILNSPINTLYSYNTSSLSTGTGVVGTFGYIYPEERTSNINVSTPLKNILNQEITATGVYLIVGNLTISSSAAQTFPRITCNIGYGATGGTTSSITTVKMINVVFTASGAGSVFNFTFTEVYTAFSVSSPNNFITVALLNDNSAKTFTAETGSYIKVTKIA